MSGGGGGSAGAADADDGEPTEGAKMFRHRRNLSKFVFRGARPRGGGLEAVRGQVQA